MTSALQSLQGVAAGAQAVFPPSGPPCLYRSEHFYLKQPISKAFFIWRPWPRHFAATLPRPLCRLCDLKTFFSILTFYFSAPRLTSLQSPQLSSSLKQQETFGQGSSAGTFYMPALNVIKLTHTWGCSVGKKMEHFFFFAFYVNDHNTCVQSWLLLFAFGLSQLS